MPTVDVNVPRFNQAIIAVVAGTAFVLNIPLLIGVLFVVVALSRFAGPKGAVLTQIYLRVVRPRLSQERPIEVEDARPPAFSQLLGAAFLGGATVAFILGYSTIGWALSLLVAALAALAATARICVGCIIFNRFAPGAEPV